MTTIDSTTPEIISELVSANYDLSDDEQASVLSESMDRYHSFFQESSTNVLMVNSHHPLSNVVRSIEAKALPTIPNIIQPYEASSRFLIVTADAEHVSEEVRRSTPAHVFRLVHPKQLSSSTPVGLPTFDDVLHLGLVTVEQLLDYYDVSNLEELGQRYVDVATNVASHEIPGTLKRPYSALGYRAIFEVVKTELLRGVVAYQNTIAMKSLAHLGILHHPLVGDSELSVDDEDTLVKSGQEGKYYPLTIEGEPWSRLEDGSPEHNVRVFTDPEYAAAHSRIAALVASKDLNLINIL